jgi:MFS family permease
MIARIVLPFAFGYFLSYLYRVINAVIAPDLVRDLGVAPRELGLLTGVYFVTFAAAQLPLGLALDRFGARRTLAVLLLVAVLGAVLFASAGSFAGVLAGRALIGLGVAACLMAAFKAYVVWFAPERLPLINGWQMAAGGLGAVAGTLPVALALDAIGWRGLFLAIAALTLVCAVVVYIFVPEERLSHTAAAPAGFGDLVRGTRRVFASSYFWRVAPVVMAVQATFLSVQGLWLGPWLRHVAALPAHAVASHLLIAAIAMVAGFIVLGWAGSRATRAGHSPLVAAVPAILVFLVVQALIIAPVTTGLPVLLAGFGFFGTSSIVGYAALSQRFPPALAGRVNTALNLLSFTAAFAAQWGIGAIIGLWPTGPAGEYHAHGYRAAFALMLALQLASLAWYLLFRRDRVPQA